MHRDTVNVTVGSGKVQVFEKIGGIRLGRDDLGELRLSSLLNKDSLARQDVDNILETKLGQGNRFRGEEVIGGAFECLGGARAEAERSNTVFITEAQYCEPKCNTVG